MEEVEISKRAIEEDGEEYAKHTAAEQVQAGSNQKKAEEHLAATKMKLALKEQMDQLRDAHQKQVGRLRDEISLNQDVISELKDVNQKFTLAHQQMQVDYERRHQEEADTPAKLQDLILSIEPREQPRTDLKGLEDSMFEELKTLHNLEALFLQDLEGRIKKLIVADDNEDDGGSLAQRQKISFLENNVDQMAKVNKLLERDNADLRCKLPKIEKELRATMERIKALETALRDTNECAMRDRKRYQYQVVRVKEAARQEYLARQAAIEEDIDEQSYT